jgi:hypothetical protein
MMGDDGSTNHPDQLEIIASLSQYISAASRDTLRLFASKPSSRRLVLFPFCRKILASIAIKNRHRTAIAIAVGPSMQRCHVNTSLSVGACDVEYHRYRDSISFVLAVTRCISARVIASLPVNHSTQHRDQCLVAV